MSIRSALLPILLVAAMPVAPALGAQQRPSWDPPTPLAPLPAQAPIAATAPLSPMAPLAPMAPAQGYGYAYVPAVGSTFGPPQRSYPQDPADSLYRAARTLLNRGEYRKAAESFARVADHRPPSAYAADALYWQAFALYRIGGTPELRQSLAALDARRSRYPDARSESEATTLATRVRGALASRGDEAAKAALARDARAGTAECDEEELAVRSSALSALQRSDPEAAQQLLVRVLDRKDECSVSLRKHAVMMIGTQGDAAAKAKLASVARSDPNASVRADAIGYLAKVSGDEVVATLDAVIRGDDVESVRRSAVRALGAHESPRAKTALRALVERTEAPEALRLEALSTFDRSGGYAYSVSSTTGQSYACAGPNCDRVTVVSPMPPTPPTPAAAPRPAERPTPAPRPGQASVSGAAAPAAVAGQAAGVWDMSTSSNERRISPEDAAWLRGAYPRLDTQRLRSRAVAVLARAQDEPTQRWLMDLVSRDEESAEVRATLVSRLGRDLPIASLARLYDNASDRTVRQQIVSTLGDRKEPEATDKLIDIVRRGTDPQLRRSAISALGRKKDPRTTQLLLELIDK